MVVYVCAAVGMLQPPPALLCRNPGACEKNHVEYYTLWDNKQQHLLMLPHFKNDVIKGTQALPLNLKLAMAFLLLEEASNFLHPQGPLFWFKNDRTTYSPPYWSQVCSKALRLPDGRRVTAKDFRHLFATMWRDFINQPSAQLAGLNLHTLDAAAAHMMCSSTIAFTNAYDDTNMARGMFYVMQHYGDFRAFAREDFLDCQSRQSINPSAIDLSNIVTWFQS